MSLDVDGLRRVLADDLDPADVDAGADPLAACVRSVYVALDERGALARIPLADPGKRAELSAYARTEGNESFAEKRLANALALYTKAVAAAPLGSEQLALAYGNRSATLFELGERDDCSADVERALAIGGTAAFIAKLERRRVACSTLTGSERHAEREQETEIGRTRLFALPLRCAENVPCASATLTVRETEASGRGVFAVEQIRPGDVLVVERPFATRPLTEHTLRRCGSCLKLRLAPIACERCRFAVYCDVRCREAARRVHLFECPIVAALDTAGFSNIELLSLRTVLTAFVRLGSWERLRVEAQRVDAEPRGVNRGRKLLNGELIYDSAHYCAIHALETNVERRAGRELRLRAVTAAAIVYLLRSNTQLFDAATPDEIDEFAQFAGGLLLHHNLTAASNMHDIEATIEDSDGEFMQREQFASGAYAFLSLINHSCEPNVVRVSVGDSIVLLALRPIKTGDEILDNYGQHHAVQPLFERQQDLLNQYKFECKCRACMENWPKYGSLQTARLDQDTKQKFNDLIDMKVIEQLQIGNKMFALSIIDELYKNVELLEDFAPSKQLADHQETIKQCWALFQNVEYFLSKNQNHD